MYINKHPRDENGLAHGEWIYYYDCGQLMYLDNWVHGIKHGLWEGYYDDGRLMYYQNWILDRQIGYWYSRGVKKYYLWLI